jgi:hypothetical protein
VTIEAFFPNWQRSKLEKIAIQRAIEVNSRYNRDPDCSKTDRLVVNMLRHEFTDYDKDRNLRRFIEACTAISANYPWLNDECRRQIAKRRKSEAERTAHLQMMQEEQEVNRQRSNESTQLIDRFYIGQTVQGRIRGHNRIGEITWIGTRRVEISFRLAPGQERRYRLYASQVAPISKRSLEGVTVA